MSSGRTTFPKEYKNVKAGEILQDYLELFSEAEVNFKDKKFILEIRKPKTWTEKIKKYLQEIGHFL